MRVRLETEAKLRIQERVASGEIELVWSYMLDYENAANPFEERRTAVSLWRALAIVDIVETPALLENARSLVALGSGARTRFTLPVPLKQDVSIL